MNHFDYKYTFHFDKGIKCKTCGQECFSHKEINDHLSSEGNHFFDSKELEVFLKRFVNRYTNPSKRF